VGIVELMLVLLVGAVWLGALVHCLMNQRLTDIQRLTWVLVIIFLNFIGGALYFVIGRSPKRGA
jgi:hypothetical protein